MERVAILIDGSNFYFKLKDLGLQDQLKFDFSGFSKLIARDASTISQKYYIGAVRTDGSPKMKKLHANQQKLFGHLQRHNYSYELGYLLKNNGKYSEKGVDVRLAVDLLINAFEHKCDKSILVSSDTDLIPAIQEAQRVGHQVEYLGFKHMPSRALLSACKQSTLLTREELIPLMN